MSTHRERLANGFDMLGEIAFYATIVGAACVVVWRFTELFILQHPVLSFGISIVIMAFIVVAYVTGLLREKYGDDE